MGSNPLPSWRPGAARTAILDFIGEVAAPGPGYVAPADRIATFDNDGTLWCEKPLYVQADFVLRRWSAMLKADPSLADRQPYKALADGDRVWLSAILDHVPELVRGLGEAFGGITTDAFEVQVQEFFRDARHPTLGTPYTAVGYRPMRELIALLEVHEFRVFICSGGGRDFVRVVADEMYGIARERVIGSAATLEYRDGTLIRGTGIEEPIDDGPGKPVHIWARTGRRPLLAGGNADGDVEMLSMARLALLVHHDDADREFAYHTGAERALAEAAAHDWTVVSMARDFKRVFA